MGATAGMILTGSQAVNSFMSQQAQAKAIDRQSDFQSQLADLNAKDAINRGEFQANARASQERQTVGAQKATFAANGVDAGSGTAADLAGDEAKFGALDQAMIRNNAALEAWGYKTNAAFDALGAKNQAATLRENSYQTLLTGAANTYGIYRESKNTNGASNYDWARGGAKSPSQLTMSPARLRGRY